MYRKYYQVSAYAVMLLYDCSKDNHEQSEGLGVIDLTESCPKSYSYTLDI